MLKRDVYVLVGTKMQEIVVSRGKILELLRPDANTGKVHTLLTVEVFGIVRSLMAFRLTGGTKGRWPTQACAYNYKHRLCMCRASHWFHIPLLRGKCKMLCTTFFFMCVCRLHRRWKRQWSYCHPGVSSIKEHV